MPLISDKTAAKALVLVGVAFAPISIVEASRRGEVHRLFLAWPVFALLGLALRAYPPSGPPDEHGDRKLGMDTKAALVGSILLGCVLMFVWEWALIVLLGSRFRT